jgi:hypothetical protein
MKSLTLFILSLFLIVQITSAQSITFSVSGKIIDYNKTAIESATITLKNLKDSSIVKIVLSDQFGNFIFNDINKGEYFITLSGTNFSSLNTKAFSLDRNYIIDTIIIPAKSQNLSAVTITSKKPFIEQKIDRIVLNVDASITNIGSTALELLEKSPGVNVDKDGNISLKGKTKVMILIDDKPSYLSGAELANLLSSMNSNQLNQIEIMTNPSAKYDATGNAGMINIKTKKGLTKGLNGNVSLNYGQGEYAKTNNSISFNYRKNKINAFLNWSDIYTKGFLRVDVVRDFKDTTGAHSFELDQKTRVISISENNSLKLGLDYFINQQSTLSISANGFLAPQRHKTNTASDVKNALDNITSLERTGRAVSNSWKNGALNINFQSNLDSGKSSISLNSDYLHYDFSGNQEVNGSTYNALNQLQATSYLKNVLPLSIDVYAGKFDYAITLNNGLKLESGIKSSIVKTNNTSLFYIGNNNQINFTDSLSNDFSYRENINACYLNLNKKINDFTFQLGLRSENTNYKGHQTSYDRVQDSTFGKRYTNLFPTIFIGYQLNDVNQFSISVGKRIERPAYQQLNPFTLFIDKYVQLAGNPFLQPQISENFEISHMYKNKFTTTLNYSVIHHMMNETLTQRDSLVIRSMGNIGKRLNVGIAENVSVTINKFYSLNLFANLYKNIYDGAVNGFILKASQVSLNLNMSNQFNFKNGWSGELQAAFTSKNREEGQAITLPIGQVSAGFGKQIFKNKGSVKINAKDIFFTQINREDQVFQQVSSHLSRARDTRVINLTFSYRFGTQSKQKNSQPTEEQKRIQIN